ncbi:MAG: transposase [Lentisphaeria bacterium]|nr:transposase [Lentisphaeria bacterium]
MSETPTKSPTADTITNVFFEPLRDALSFSEHTRECPRFSDWAHLRAGVGRCLERVQSGRDWIQQLWHEFSMKLGVSCFFESLGSTRRLELAQEVNARIASRCDTDAGASDDPFSAHPELKDFGVYAADGHYHACSAHEDAIEGKRYAVGHFFVANLRTQSMRHLDVARPKRKRENDITALKRLNPEILRMGEPKGRKVLIAYDPAIVDFVQWYNWKQAKGIYIVTREKKNMALYCCGEPDFDRDDPRNNGVVSDEWVGHSHGRMIRRITYVDPVHGKTYRFITNEMTLPPGLIAFIYKRRWDIEKIFDQMKNKLLEKKAWAKSPTAKCQQAAFMCLTHNLMLIFERTIEEREAITDEKIRTRMAARLLGDADKAEAAGRQMNPMLLGVRRSVQRSLQFIRWLRWALSHAASWRPAIDELRPLMAQYMT